MAQNPDTKDSRNLDTEDCLSGYLRLKIWTLKNHNPDTEDSRNRNLGHDLILGTTVVRYCQYEATVTGKQETDQTRHKPCQ